MRKVVHNSLQKMLVNLKCWGVAEIEDDTRLSEAKLAEISPSVQGQNGVTHKNRQPKRLLKVT
jgi:hypothetical protein